MQFRRLRTRLEAVGAKSRYLPLLASIGRDRDPAIGPLELMVDFCNACNLHCLCCYNYSPLSPCRFDREERLRAFPTDLFLRLLGDCTDLGVRKINLAGYGEPLLHPDCEMLLREMGRGGLQAYVTTNGTLLSKYAWAVRSLYGATVSVHAGSEETYRIMHPSDPAESWNKTREGLRLLQAAAVPTSIAFVLCSENAGDLENVIDLAGEFGAHLAVQPIRPFIRAAEGKAAFDPEKSGALQLERRQVDELVEKRSALARRAAARGVPVYGLWEFLDLTGQAAVADDPGTSRHMGDLYDRQPCYVGWHFSRILLDGTVTACCQCVGGITLGNIRERSFAEIWRSQEYRAFRNETLQFPLRETGIWRACQCTVCDQVPRNLRIHQQLTGNGPLSQLVRMARPLARR